MSKPASSPNWKIVVENRRARHNYTIEETYEAGIALQGSEVKALREGKGQIAEAYAMVRDGEAFIEGMTISPYSGASTHVVLDSRRTRKLLLHRKQIAELAVATQQKGMTLVPLRVYFTHGIAKLELGLARGKQNIDKRRTIAERDAKRQMERASRRREKGR
ncbi:MAG: SsrA-binding protein SmpB [Actinomycetota bacterium]